jgi:hypothetical protein
MANKTKFFDGVHDTTIFIADHNTDSFQFALEKVEGGGKLHHKELYELTIASVDSNKKRKEYVLFATDLQLKVLRSILNNAFNQSNNFA